VCEPNGVSVVSYQTPLTLKLNNNAQID